MKIEIVVAIPRPMGDRFEWGKACPEDKKHVGFCFIPRVGGSVSILIKDDAGEMHGELVANYSEDYRRDSAFDEYEQRAAEWAKSLVSVIKLATFDDNQIEGVQDGKEKTPV
ncbi:TPA: hypothetical protein ACYSDT_001528 [Klebsiella oxytoca]|uniref:hypothetical protein n=1 Tax=Klebsiella grimontii TaxID=2058152 RepID=UPI0029302289|nr:hypothetical protein [Klebsiella grimontii]